MDMTEDIFGRYPSGKAALEKLGPSSENFRFYEAEWLGDVKCRTQIMKFTGAEFRTSKSGISKGTLSIIMKGTGRTVYVTPEEIDEYQIMK